MKRTMAITFALCILMSLTGCVESSRTKMISDSMTVSAKYDENGWAYLCHEQGEVTLIKENVLDARMTPDRKHIVVLQNDGLLYYTDPLQSKKTKVADHVKAIECIQDEGFFYQNEDSELFRISFSKEASFHIPDSVLDTAFSDNCLNVLYASKNGKIYSLRSGSSEPKQVGSFKYAVKLAEISDNGNISAWYCEELNKYIPVINDDRNTEELDSIKGTPSFDDFVYFSKDNKVCVLLHYSDKKIYIKKENKDTIQVDLPNKISDDCVYTAVGALEDTESSKLEALYCLVRAGSGDEENIGSDLYQITLDGEKKRVFSGVRSCKVVDHVIVFKKLDDTMYYATIKNGIIGEPVKIADTVDSFQVFPCSNYVCYFQGSKASANALYACQFGEEPFLIATDVWEVLQFGTDGDTLFYLKREIEKDSAGTLMMIQLAEKGKNEIIVDDSVRYNSLSSNLKSGQILPNDFYFQKLCSGRNDELLFDLMHWDGAKVNRVAPRLINRVEYPMWW